MRTLLEAATIGKTHGVDGYLKLFSLSGEYSHLSKLKECSIVLRDGKEIKAAVESVRISGDLFLIRFRGYETPEAARVLSGGVVRINRSEATELDDGEFYIADFYGLTVLCGGREVGRVVDASEGAQAIFLNIDAGGKTRYVPYLPVFVSHPDLDNGTIELLMPDLLD